METPAWVAAEMKARGIQLCDDPEKYLGTDEEGEARKLLLDERTAELQEFVGRMMLRVPRRFRDASWDDVEEPEKYGQQSVASGVSVVLVSKTGLGKSYAAVAACRERAMAGKRVWWLNTAETLYMMRESYNGGERAAALSKLAAAEFVVLDDVGVERPNDFAIETLNVIVNKVYESGAQTFTTSNLTVTEIAKQLGPRIAGRLVENAEVFTLDGPNRRLSRWFK